MQRHYQHCYRWLAEQAKGYAKMHPGLAPYLAGARHDPLSNAQIEQIAYLAGRLQQQQIQQSRSLKQQWDQYMWPFLAKPYPSCTVLACQTSQTLTISPGMRCQTEQGIEFQARYHSEITPLQLEETCWYPDRLEFKLCWPGSQIHPNAPLLIYAKGLNSDIEQLHYLLKDATFGIANNTKKVVFDSEPFAEPMLTALQAYETPYAKWLDYFNFKAKAGFFALNNFWTQCDFHKTQELTLACYFSHPQQPLAIEFSLNCLPVINLQRSQLPPVRCQQPWQTQRLPLEPHQCLYHVEKVIARDLSKAYSTELATIPDPHAQYQIVPLATQDVADAEHAIVISDANSGHPVNLSMTVQHCHVQLASSLNGWQWLDAPMTGVQIQSIQSISQYQPALLSRGSFHGVSLPSLNATILQECLGFFVDQNDAIAKQMLLSIQKITVVSSIAWINGCYQQLLHVQLHADERHAYHLAAAYRFYQHCAQFMQAIVVSHARVKLTVYLSQQSTQWIFGHHG